MRRDGAEREEGERGGMDGQHGGRGGKDGYYEATLRGGTRSSRSPNGRKRRAVAADLFDDEHEHDDHDDRRSNSNNNNRHRSSARRSESPPPPQHEHKRRKHHNRREREQPHHHERRHHHHHAKRSDKVASPSPAIAAELPFQARHLSYKHDFDAFTALFAYYLDIQKGLDFYALDSHEARGRWKSFVNKWNRGELAEGWYEPEMYERITREDPARMGMVTATATTRREYFTGDKEGADEEHPHRGDYPEEEEERERPDNTIDPVNKPADAHHEEDDVDDYGPPPPPGQSSSSTGGGPRHGPGIPTRADLTLQREAAAKAAQSDFAALRLARKADRVQQKERLDELLPRAEPGTRERQLEKKALVNEKMRSFRDKGGGDAMEEVGDKDLLGGGGEDDLAEYKRMISMQQRKKTERELRREAEARARVVEREERLREWKEREEEKLRGLKELAKARFG